MSESDLVLQTLDEEAYRAVHTVTELEIGSKRAAVEEDAEFRREWTPVAFTVALILAAPLLASATLGLL